MLVLTRKIGQKIVIGENIVLTVVDIRRDEQYGDRIRIGLEAPSHVSICRQEILDQAKPDLPATAPASADDAEAESRRLRQKIEALESQMARHSHPAMASLPLGEVAKELICLRRRCDVLLDQLGPRAAPNDRPSQ